MKIIKTTIDIIKKYRTDYLNTLPEFQELFIELMINNSDCYLLLPKDKEVGYIIINKEGIIIEFYVMNPYIPQSNKYFRQALTDLNVKGIYCKSFDALLLSNCLLSSLSYSVLGLMYRDYAEALIEEDLEIKMEKAELSSVELLLRQDHSIRELFETERQLTDFIQNEHVFLFSKSDNLMGCGMVVRTKVGWNYCDLGVWVNPSNRGNAHGARIISKMRAFALKNNMIPSCGCALENVASQKTIEKSGYISKHKMIHFNTRSTSRSRTF